MEEKSKKIAVFPGSFDPFTKGHFDIVMRGISLFDQIIIGIGHNSQKKRYFDVEFMAQKIKEACCNEPKIKIEIYNELTSEFARKYHANFLLRGLRNTTDFEYENSISQVNNYLNKDLETFFLITSPNYASISSSLVREIHKFGADISPFIPYEI
jgi:pantetheine-phosphate adenylyltransferase